MKIAIIGVGMVGSMSAFLLAKGSVGKEIVLVDVDLDKARTEALDIAQSMGKSGNTRVFGESVEGILESDIVVITAGVKQEIGEKRENLRERNEKVMEKIVDDIKKFAPNAMVVVATNPLDDMVEFVKNNMGEGKRVIGTGTELDSYRFRYYLGKYFKVNPQSVRADVWGQHNEKAKFMWNSVYIGGIELDEFVKNNGIVWGENKKREIERKVVNSAFEIIRGKGATYFAIANVIFDIVKDIVYDEKRMFNVSLGKDGSRSVIV